MLTNATNENKISNMLGKDLIAREKIIKFISQNEVLIRPFKKISLYKLN